MTATPPSSIDLFNSAIATEEARPVSFDKNLASRDAAVTATLERFHSRPLETDLDEFLTAQAVKLSLAAARESFGSIALPNRQRMLADAYVIANKETGERLLQTQLAERVRPRAAKMAALGKETASVQESMFKPDLPHPELIALEARRAKLTDEAAFLDSAVASAKNQIAYFSNETTAENWRAAARAVQAVNFS
ncbi:MAG: hypothetical protein NTW21_39555 [Verrucomicrobia bacterium]|nr:hypothetical protein [Verrucomicrobiota bacterium]